MLWELLITLNDPPSPVDQTNLEEGPPREHIFYQPPSARAESLNTIHSQLEELDKALEKVRDLKKKVLEAEKQIIRNIGQVHQLTSPIGSLPNELLHEIFFCVVSGSRDYLAIQSLSAVCQRWRTYMFGQTQWFSDANWDEWPPSLIIEWCGRTGSHPLTIRLTEPGLKRISTPCSSRCSCVPANGDVCFLSTLKGCMEKCCELHVETERRDAETFDARNHVLFAPYRPSLHSLSYSVDNVDPVSGAREFDYEAERFPIPWVSFAINAPNLRILRLHGVIITSDLVSLEDLSLDLNYNPERSDYQQLRRYYRFDLLKKLTLCNWGLHLPKFFNPDDMSSLQSFGLVDSPFKSLREVFVNKDIACLTLQEVCFADTLPNLSDLETIVRRHTQLPPVPYTDLSAGWYSPMLDAITAKLLLGRTPRRVARSMHIASSLSHKPASSAPRITGTRDPCFGAGCRAVANACSVGWV